ncbi:MAG: two-component system response regulator [Cycloclasticus sp. symbiont of Poecilosclerida sp. M]|nr:MAG: two-component system response regulator [Cycloclasticus sp. symbiont of Poecilosclerida sp. M]
MTRILVVDDSPTAIHIITGMLKKNGYEFITAVDGQEGVDMAGAEKPGLILMDVVMPNVDGFKATRTLARDDVTKDIPIIILSNKSQPTDKLWGKKQGAKDYLVKPINEAELINAIKANVG